MLNRIKSSIFLGYLLLSLNASGWAVELLLWQVPEASSQTVVFYQEPSKKSKTITAFQPMQVMQIGIKQKEWAKVNALDNSGQAAWVRLEDVKSVTTLHVDLEQAKPDAYRCRVLVQDPEGRQVGNCRIGYHMDGVSDEKIKKAQLDFEAAFIKQQEAMNQMMKPLFELWFEEAGLLEKGSEKADTQASLATQPAVEPNKKDK